MTDSRISLRDILPVVPDTEPGGRAGSPSAGEFSKFKQRIKEEAKAIRWAASMPDLVEKIAQLLDIPLPDIMVQAWRKDEEIGQALEESRDSPGEDKYVDLAEHSMATEFHPKIEIRVGKGFRKTLEFLVEISVSLKAAELHLRGGEIQAVRPGSCEAAGSVRYQELLIAEKKLGRIELPEIMLVNGSS